MVAAIAYYGADKGMVITNSVYTQNAVNLATANGVELWDRKRLFREFRKVSRKDARKAKQATRAQEEG